MINIHVVHKCYICIYVYKLETYLLPGTENKNNKSSTIYKGYTAL